MARRNRRRSRKSLRRTRSSVSTSKRQSVVKKINSRREDKSPSRSQSDAPRRSRSESRINRVDAPARPKTAPIAERSSLAPEKYTSASQSFLYSAPPLGKPNVANPGPIGYNTRLSKDEVIQVIRLAGGTATPQLISALTEHNWPDNSSERSQMLANLAHESQNFTRDIENLNYGAARLREKFGKYFNDAQALAYARQPEKIANRAYANRLGNGNEASGDGWTYRGRGMIQLTGKKNYADAGKALGLDLVKNPELARVPKNALKIADWYWDTRKIGEAARNGDTAAVRKKINGGYNGLGDVETKVANLNAANVRGAPNLPGTNVGVRTDSKIPEFARTDQTVMSDEDIRTSEGVPTKGPIDPNYVPPVRPDFMRPPAPPQVDRSVVTSEEEIARQEGLERQYGKKDPDMSTGVYRTPIGPSYTAPQAAPAPDGTLYDYKGSAPPAAPFPINYQEQAPKQSWIEAALGINPAYGGERPDNYREQFARAMESEIDSWSAPTGQGMVGSINLPGYTTAEGEAKVAQAVAKAQEESRQEDAERAPIYQQSAGPNRAEYDAVRRAVGEVRLEGASGQTEPGGYTKYDNQGVNDSVKAAVEEVRNENIPQGASGPVEGGGYTARRKEREEVRKAVDDVRTTTVAPIARPSQPAPVAPQAVREGTIADRAPNLTQKQKDELNAYSKAQREGSLIDLNAGKKGTPNWVPSGKDAEVKPYSAPVSAVPEKRDENNRVKQAVDNVREEAAQGASPSMLSSGMSVREAGGYQGKDVDDRVIHEMAAIVLGEAGGKNGGGLEGMTATAETMRNRAEAAGTSLRAAYGAPQQYSALNAGEGGLDLTNMAKHPQYKTAVQAVKNALAGSDLAGGATSYHANYVSPDWAAGRQPNAVYGAHRFYNDQQLRGWDANKTRIAERQGTFSGNLAGKFGAMGDVGGPMIAAPPSQAPSTMVAGGGKVADPTTRQAVNSAALNRIGDAALAFMNRSRDITNARVVDPGASTQFPIRTNLTNIPVQQTYAPDSQERVDAKEYNKKFIDGVMQTPAPPPDTPRVDQPQNDDNENNLEETSYTDPSQTLKTDASFPGMGDDYSIGNLFETEYTQIEPSKIEPSKVDPIEAPEVTGLDDSPYSYDFGSNSSLNKDEKNDPYGMNGSNMFDNGLDDPYKSDYSSGLDFKDSTFVPTIDPISTPKSGDMSFGDEGSLFDSLSSGYDSGLDFDSLSMRDFSSGTWDPFGGKGPGYGSNYSILGGANDYSNRIGLSSALDYSNFSGDYDDFDFGDFYGDGLVSSSGDFGDYYDDYYDYGGDDYTYSDNGGYTDYGGDYGGNYY